MTACLTRSTDAGLKRCPSSDLIETGETRRMDAERLFIFKRYPDRHDNLMCAAAVEEDRLVIKTVMVGWTLREQT